MSKPNQETQDTSDVVIAYCGLVCSNCGFYTKGRCQGCHSDRPMLPNCKTKACAIRNNYTTCAACETYADLRECNKLHNFFTQLSGLIFRTDRIANLERIREIGLEAFKAEKARDDRP